MIDQIMNAIAVVKAHWDMIAFVWICIEQILPKLKVVDASSMMELVPEVIGMIIKLIKGDYKQDPPPPAA